MKIFERVYDNPLNEDGTNKPNKYLGNFEIIKGDMNDYSYVVYAKKGKSLYKISGREVSGYYHPKEGGTKNFIENLTDTEDVKVYLKNS